ncbi:prephenate dehydratase [bacterium]|nr:prephenate dehydratase [bacterium]
MERVAFQGEKGAYSEDAAYHYFGNQIRCVPKDTFKNVFHAVLSSECEYGIIPIENTTTGSIHHNVDLLLEFNLSIVGEVILRIQHNLLALKKIRLKDIQKVYSHPQALEQCSHFLNSLKNIEIIPMYDTAGSARYIAEEKSTIGAAIASHRAGAVYNLHVIKKDIENNHQNYTRFLIISRTLNNPKQGGKTSIVFSTKNIPGALFKSLSVFALRDINLLKIESRPLRKGPWEYWFYLDFEGSIEEKACRNAINHLKEITDFLKILGSYPNGKVFE